MSLFHTFHHPVKKVASVFFFNLLTIRGPPFLVGPEELGTLGPKGPLLAPALVSPAAPTACPGQGRWSRENFGTDHHEQLWGNPPAKGVQREGSDGHSWQGMLCHRELQLERDGRMEVQNRVILGHFHKDCLAPAADGKKGSNYQKARSFGRGGGGASLPRFPTWVPPAIPTHLLLIQLFCWRTCRQVLLSWRVVPSSWM